MAAELVVAHTVTGPANSDVRVRVMFYNDGSIRFRVNKTPLVIDEAYLHANKDGYAMIKVAPRHDPNAPRR
jgi:hypothetical protein